jgi:hypothetical protein
MPSTIHDSEAGRYAEHFQDAAVRFAILHDAETRNLREIAMAGAGITIETRKRTWTRQCYSLFQVKFDATSPDGILQAMERARDGLVVEEPTRI